MKEYFILVCFDVDYTFKYAFDSIDDLCLYLSFYDIYSRDLSFYIYEDYLSSEKMKLLNITYKKEV